MVKNSKQQWEVGDLSQWTKAEIDAAQIALNTHPNTSSYWGSNAGQEAMRIARAVGLKAGNSNRQRAAIYAAKAAHA